ncbi:uncharacterized protein BO80DRAFT_202371, partial [Aspergillus ibericus CBS 121593]
MLTPGMEDPSQGVAFYTNMGLDTPTALEAAEWPAYCLRFNAKALFEWEMGERYAGFTIPGLVVQGVGSGYAGGVASETDCGGDAAVSGGGFEGFWGGGRVCCRGDGNSILRLGLLVVF